MHSELHESTSTASLKTGHRYNLSGLTLKHGEVNFKSRVHSLISVVGLCKAQSRKSTAANIVMQYHLHH